MADNPNGKLSIVYRLGLYQTSPGNESGIIPAHFQVNIKIQVQALIEQIQKVAVDFAPELLKIGEEDFSYKSDPSKWSKKEILGHLVDSAQNNIRRFVVSQYEDIPKIVYQQDS